MVAWNVRFKKSSKKDSVLLKRAGLKSKTESILTLLEENPFRVPPPCEKLIGDLRGFYSRRINRQHRVIFEVRPETREVVVLRMWSHYGN